MQYQLRLSCRRKSISCTKNMTYIGYRVQLWKLENDKDVFPSGVITDNAEVEKLLSPYFSTKVPRCPKNGTYVYDDNDYSFTCSVHRKLEKKDILWSV